MSVEKRQNFLEASWVAYPPAPADGVSLEEWRLRGEGEIPKSATVFGRFYPNVTHESFSLRWGRVALELAQNWAKIPLLPLPRDTELDTAASAKDILVPDDIVAVEFVDSKVVSFQLLVPCRAPALRNVATTGQILEAWSRFLATTRSYFLRQNFLEGRTPTLVPSPGLEPFLEPCSVNVLFGGKDLAMYLPTSPEFHLKKLISMGVDRVFEFKDCFRNGEVAHHHQIEFLMLEWYRAFSSLDNIVADLLGLVSELKKDPLFQKAQSLQLEPEVLTVADLFKRHIDFTLTPTTTARELALLARERGVFADSSEDFDDVFFRLFLEFVEPHLGKAHPQIVKHWPPSQAALARLTKEGWADRFEFYVEGLEIANAFHELNDPVEQRRRFARDIQKKLDLGRDPVPVDPEFLQALDFGLPPASGIALGVDRLFMAMTGIREISNSRVFPLRPEDFDY
jgi:lysyl-tRNA synthetase class 2